MPKIELIESSLRHGQQTLLSSRLRTRHMVELAERLDGSGVAGLDVFGGATFGVALEYLGEDPFQRLREVRQATKIPLHGLLRGQSLVGSGPVADDVVDSFVETLAEQGLDVFRCFDPLNDIRNLARVATAVNRAGKRAEGALVYTESPAHSQAGFIALGSQLKQLGFTSLCLFDPAGLLGAGSARAIVSGLVQETGLPIFVHCATITGQASFAYLAAAEAGASGLDVCLSPLAGGASLPNTEGVVRALAGTDHDPEVDQARLLEAADRLEELMPLYELVADPSGWQLDSGTLRTQLAPSVQQHLTWECQAQGAQDRRAEVVEEIGRVRADMGYPPLITPIAEVVVTQAVANVASGDRYLIVAQDVKDYFLGLYGEPPGPPDPEVQKLVIGQEEPITVRPGDVLEPMLEEARHTLARSDMGEPSQEALLEFVLFPEAAARQLRGEARHERLDDEPADGEPVDQEVVEPPALVDGGDLSEPIGDAAAIPVMLPAPAGADGPSVAPQEVAREFQVEVDGEIFEVRVTSRDGGLAAVGVGPGSAPVAPASGAVRAPMQGLIAKIPVKVGDPVEVGQTIAVLEAMKMQNDIPSDRAGTVQSVNVSEGQVVSRGDPLVTVG
ncbi:MAG: pyruvate carboxylase subunit B [Candidatus Dormibacteria bacterium]